MKKFLCMMLSILLILSSVAGCSFQKPDETENTTQTNPSESLLGTEATSPSTESTNTPSENTDPSDVTDPTDGSQPSENTNPSNGTEPSIGTEPSEDMTEPSDGTNPSEGTTPTERPTEPPVTEPTPTQSAPTKPPHSHAYNKTVTTATCTTGGYTTYTCVCGDSYIADQTNAKGHSYTDTVVPPTTSERGYTKHVCACGHSYKDSFVDKIVEEFPFTESELCAAVVKYINEYRDQEGNGELIAQVGMGNVAQYRSVQLLTNYAHDIKDKRQALAYYEYGRYIDMTQYGFDESYNYYEADTQEAIGHVAAIREPVDETAKIIALLFKSSTDHWSYLGAPENKYIGVGCSKDNHDWYICIMVSEITYG